MGKNEKVKFLITDACINCGACASICPSRAIEPKGAKHVITEKCVQCGNCVSICPVEAIIMEGE